MYVNPKLAALAPGLRAALMQAHDQVAAALLRAAAEHLKAAAELERQRSTAKRKSN